MKRRILALLCALCMLSALAACGSTPRADEEIPDASRTTKKEEETPPPVDTAESDEPDIIITEPSHEPEPTTEPTPEPTPEPEMISLDPSELPASLEEFLLYFDFGYYDSDGGREYDSEKCADSETNLLAQIISAAPCADMTLYPGKLPVTHWNDGTADPRGWSAQTGAYAEFDPEQIRWVAINVFNLSEPVFQTLLKRGEEDGLFYQDRNAEGEDRYFTLIGGVGGPGMRIQYESAAFNGTRYELVYQYLIEPDYYLDSYYTELELKTIDGQVYWSIYRHTNQIPQTEPADAPELFGELKKTFFFSSGVGAWWTEIKIAADGSFTGHFQDSNLGESGEGYDGTIYYADFRGRFVNPKKLNAYTYTVELGSLEYLDKTEDFIVDDEDGWRIRNSYSYAYGIEGGKIFYLYAPGAPIKKLPEGFMSWYLLEKDVPENVNRLPNWGLYNITEDNGFAS